MARKRTKKEAKERIDDIPTPPIPPLLRPFVPPPLRALALLAKPAKAVAKTLVDIDPLNRLADETSTVERVQAAQEAFEILVNDPNIKMAAEEVQMINDDNVKIVRTGNGPTPIRTDSGQIPIDFSGQVGRDVLLSKASRRTRKKTKTDKSMSKALAEANKRLRKRNGQLRKGVTQADIMRLAHRIRRKMK